MANPPFDVRFLVRLHVSVNRAGASGALRELQKLIVRINALERQQVADRIDIPQILVHGDVGCC